MTNYVEYSIYDSTTGEIKRVIQVPDQATADSMTGATEANILGNYDGKVEYYDVANSAIAPRPANGTTLPALSLGILGQITGIPNNSTLVIRDDDIVVLGVGNVTTGTADVTISYAGDFNVEVRSFPELDFTGVLTVV